MDKNKIIDKDKIMENSNMNLTSSKKEKMLNDFVASEKSIHFEKFYEYLIKDGGSREIKEGKVSPLSLIEQSFEKIMNNNNCDFLKLDSDPKKNLMLNILELQNQNPIKSVYQDLIVTIENNTFEKIKKDNSMENFLQKKISGSSVVNKTSQKNR